MTNKLDQIYRSLRMTKYFVNGWGKPENLKRLCEFRKIVANRETCYKLVSPDYPVEIEKEVEEKDCILINGSFFSPLALYLPDVVPDVCKTAYFQMVLPKKWNDDRFKPLIFHTAGTGDQYFWRRRNFIAKPLIKEACIGSIIIENPFYGLRKPKEQKRSILLNVSDIFVMGGCLMLEALVLFHFSERLGYGPLGTTGLSMGGHLASLAATTWPKPIVVVPCLSSLTASHVFTQGAISHALNWKMLEKQYISNDCLKNEVQKMVKIIEGDAFKAGQIFAKQLSKKVSTLPSSCGDSTAQIAFKDVKTSFLIESNEAAKPLSNVKSVATLSAILGGQLGDADRQHEKYDNYCNLEIDNTIRNDVTSALLSKDVDLSTTIQSSHLCDDNANNKEELVKTETTNKLLNLVVRLTRASINLNILAEKTKEELTELKENEASSGEQQAIYFMTGIMDECTHLKNFAVPADTSLTIAVCADNDAYVPDRGMTNIQTVWPEAEVRYVKGGHVRAYLQYQKEFRHAIVDAFEKYRQKYVNKTPNT